MSEAWKQWEGRIVDGKFPLRQYLGSSEHSAVFLTERGEQAQKAAIKFIQVEPVNAELQLSRWQRAAKLSHPHLLKLFECGRCRIADFNLLYLVMEFANENLGEFLPQRPLTPAEARDVLAPTLEALDLLHREGLVHGHIQPSNILAIDDQLKLSCDTAMAAAVVKGDKEKDEATRAAGEDQTRAITTPGESATLRRPSPYCAPEALKGAATPAADTWSLGMTLVEMLTQRPPAYDNSSRQDPLLPETLPALFADIARHCLRRDPQARWTVKQIAERLNPGSGAPPQVSAPAAAPAQPSVAPLAPAAVSVAPSLLAGIPVLAPPPAPVSASMPPVSGLRPPAPTVSAAASAATAPARVPPPVPSKSEPYHIPAARPPLHSGSRGDKYSEIGLPKLKQPPLLPKAGYFVGGVALGLLIFALIGIKVFSHRGPEQEKVQQQAAAVATGPATPVDTKAGSPPGKGKIKSQNPGKVDAKSQAKVDAKTAQKPSSPLTTPAPSNAQAQHTAQTQTASAGSSAAAASVRSGPAESAALKAGPLTSVTDKQPVVPTAPAASSHNDSLSAATVPATVSGGSVVKGEILNQVIPDVSQKARSTIRGTVRVAVKVHVDSTGNIAAAQLDSPGPSKFFADKALEAAKSWDFAPAKLDGHNVASSWIIRFHFTQTDTKVFPAEETP